MLLGAYFSNEGSTRGLGSQAFAAGTGRLVTDQFADQKTSSRSIALFADGTINITPELGLSLGARYTWDRKQAALVRTNALTPAAGFSSGGQQRNWSQFTPRAVLKYQATPNILAYASYARGYTAGGFNTEAATLAALQAPFQPETVDNFEGGIKSEWLNHRLRVNINGFHLKYNDKQELFFNNVTRILNITNAAKATVNGFEVELSAKPLSWLGLGATYGYLDTRYDQFVIPGGATLTGNQLGSSPQNKVSANADINIPLGSGRVMGNVAYSYTDGYFTGATNEAGLFVRGYTLVNAMIGYVFPDDRIEVQAFVRNAFNQDYVLIPSTQTVRANYLGAPRIIGGGLTVRF